MLSRVPVLLAPFAILASALRLGPQAEFLTAFLALIPLAGLLGEVTEELALHTGPRIGGLLNATLGTMTELIIMFALLRSGQIFLLKASIVGSILISLLFTVGFAILLGGIKNGRQPFDRQSVGLAATTMILAVVGLLVPTLFSFLVELQQHSPITADFSNRSIDQISVVVAAILFFLYLLTVVYQLSAPEGERFPQERCVRSPGKASRSMRRTLGMLAIATIGIAAVGEILSASVQPFGAKLGLSYLFLGVVILPVAGSISEILVCVKMARSNQVDLALSIPMNGAMQIPLFVAPMLVFLSAFGPAPLTLYFSIVEVIAVAIAVSLAAYIVIDGVTSWLEGVQLLALWGILAVWFYFYDPTPELVL
ncbi:MAG: calcium/proton exchanger [Terrimicrobiaceae bacterium]